MVPWMSTRYTSPSLSSPNWTQLPFGPAALSCVTTGLLVNPVIMVLAFLGIVSAPVFMVLAGIQVIRRVAEYAVAKPTREMLFTIVDQESRYKAKNVIDTVVYRFGDLSAAWVSSVILPFGVAGLAIFGVIVAAAWFPVGLVLGRRYEDAKGVTGVKS